MMHFGFVPNWSRMCRSTCAFTTPHRGISPPYRMTDRTQDSHLIFALSHEWLTPHTDHIRRM